MGSEVWATTVTANGTDLRVHATGSGPPVVLAHGITDSGPGWARVARSLAADHEVVMVDARGHGESSHPGSYTFREHVTDLVDVLAALGLPPVVLVGHSMAGPHVATVAAEHPQRVRAVVLVDPHWPRRPEGPEDYDLAGWRADVAADTARPLDDLIADGRRDHPSWSEDDLLPWARAKQVVDPEVTSWLRSAADINRWRDVVGRVRCPTLLVTGDPAVDGNVTVGPEVAAEARRLCPSLSVLHLAGAGHSIQRDRLSPFVAGLRTFLDRLRANESGAGT
ncbi:MAG: alpha/beta fold hydrolase [Kineosporiaceae bacterium]